MKKRAISFVLCLMMVVTLFGNGIPVYAANELDQPIVATEETSQDGPEESYADEIHAMDTSEVAPTETTDEEETTASEEGTEATPSEAADTEESETVNTPDTTEEAVTEETPDTPTPSESDLETSESDNPEATNGEEITIATPSEADNGLIQVPGENHLTLQEAITAAPDNTPTTIVITGDVTLGSRLEIPANKQVKIQSADGHQYTIRGDQDARLSSIILVQEGSKIAFENITLDGTGTKTSAMTVRGEATLGDGAIFTRTDKKESDGRAVFLDAPSSLFILDGGTISNFQVASEGAGVLVWDGIFSMRSGKIENCTAKWGGGVALSDEGSFVMSG